jgi:hypothetical protein
MKVPKATKKQEEILELLYTYRFLNRIQIQTLLHHKNRKNINVWLQDLRDKHYVEWIYSTDFTEKTKPAIYYLGINGVRYLRGTKNYPLAEIRKRYYESGRSGGFISRSVALAGISIDLDSKTDENIRYACHTAAKYVLPNSEFHFLMDTAALRPDVYYTKQLGGTSTTYLLVLLDATLPRYRVRNRLKVYAEYLDYHADEWRRLSGESERPTVLFICPTVADLLYAKRRTRKLLESSPERDDIHIKFALAEDIAKGGVTVKVWEEA